jgi:hypothetical protein
VNCVYGPSASKQVVRVGFLTFIYEKISIRIEEFILFPQAL